MTNSSLHGCMGRGLHGKGKAAEFQTIWSLTETPHYGVSHTRYSRVP
jgi:hypothetical protein